MKCLVGYRGVREIRIVSKETSDIVVIRSPLEISRRFCSTNSNTKGKQNKKTKPYNILFFGSDKISIKTLDILYENKVNPESTPFGRIVNQIEAVCPQDKGPSPSMMISVPVKIFSQQHNIPIHHPLPSIKEWKVPLSKNGEPFDVAVVVSFGYLIPSHVINSFPMGGINMHPSLLPKYRGAAPIYHTLLNQETETGVSVIELSKDRFDVGKILQQVKYPIESTTTYGPLTDHLADIGAKMILSTLNDFWKYKENAIPQGEGACSAPKVKKEMGFIQWDKHTAEDVWRLWRALGDTVGIYTRYKFNGQQVRLHKLKPPQFMMSYKNQERFDSQYSPGMLKYDKNHDLIFIKCAKGWIACEELQVECKIKLGAYDFVNGYGFRSIKIPTEDHKFVSLTEAAS